MSFIRGEIIEDTEEKKDAMQDRFLTFVVGQEVFGIEIRLVKEIIGIQPINTLPEVPEYVRGLVNLRGRIFPVIDMRLRLEKEAVEYTDRTCIIVIEPQKISAGLIVDRVAEVLRIGEEDISPPPEMGEEISSRYIYGIGKVDGKVKLLLDCDKLFSDEGTEILDQA